MIIEVSDTCDDIIRLRTMTLQEDEAMTYQSVNPDDGKLLKTFEELTDKQLETALETAAICFETWRHKTFAERAVVVAKAAAIMHARVDEFARPVTLEMGKLFDEARGEVVFSADIIDYYAKNAERFLAPLTSSRLQAKHRSKAARSACSSASSPGIFPTTSSLALPRPT